MKEITFFEHLLCARSSQDLTDSHLVFIAIPKSVFNYQRKDMGKLKARFA